ncbi:MAG TPA: hypothetical protein VHU19_07875 [Pyrinomonadaceae bacterium]|jgi:hypothetical protein|nr:hypothetical protein [Pyrinomonadaceae bacterium]
MKKLLASCALSSLALVAAGAFFMRATQDASAQNTNDARAQRQRIVGEVITVDAETGRVTIRTDAGEAVTLTTDDKTAYLRLPPGETAIERAVRATRADVRVGDRVLAPGVAATGGWARQLILMSRGDAAAQVARDETHRLLGRVAAIDAVKKQFIVETRSREGFGAVTLDASGGVRFLRFAPDSLRAGDAQPASFADVRVGDTLRATGERSADGTRFTPEEIITGAFTRVVGIVSSVDAARGELTVRNEQTGQTVKVIVGARSTLKHVTPEFTRAIAERAERAARSGQERVSGETQQQANANGNVRREGDGGRRGGSLQQMLESLPSVAVADLKKGDAVVVTATPGADSSRATAITLVTGDADFLRRLQQLQRGTEGNPRRMSPGLPSDVLGGGVGNGNGNANVNAPPER